MNALYKTINLVTGKEIFKEAKSESAGAGDAGVIMAANAAGKLDETWLPAGVGAETKVLPSSENFGAGQFVNEWIDTGTTKVRLADANNGRPATGYVKAATTSPANATVYPLGTINSDLSGMTPGAAQFLSKTAGGVTEDISAWADTDIVQLLGYATSATEMLTENHVPAAIEEA